MIEGVFRSLESVLDRQRDAWLAGDRPSIEDLLSGTSIANDAETQLDLLYNEIVLREELGQTPTLDEYLGQHPHLQDELRIHFEIHHAIRQQLLLEADESESPESLPEAHSHLSDLVPEEDYEIMHVLGQGGMATVYQARHRRLNRLVALKLFQHGRRLTSREVLRVRTEAEAMARISHPNIVRIFEIGEHRGTPYLALELAEHGTLSGKLQQFQYSPVAAAELIETLAIAVHHAHERQIIHRDLKPANVLFALDGRPLITDFGLAKIQHDRLVDPEDATRSGEALGTPRYMAPEQAAGMQDLICPATDVHGLGVLLYECLTGRAPFMSTSVVQTLHHICHDDPMPLRRLDSGIPKDLENICMHCLEKRPSHRYTSAKDLADDLRRFLNHEPVVARTTPFRELLLKWCRRKPAQATLIIGTGILLCAAGAAVILTSLVHRSRLADQRREIADLVLQGRTALEQDDVDAAQARFETAWMIVQAEPELADHETSVYGWLDHSRNVASRHQWTQRTPPPLFDERRDEALLLSLMVIPEIEHQFEAAMTAIRSAREFTLANDARWYAERETLSLQESALLEKSMGVESALVALNVEGPYPSRIILLRRADLLSRLGRARDAADARAAGEAMPVNRLAAAFQTGMDHLRGGNFLAGSAEFDTVLTIDPAHFAARLFQAVCFLKLQHPEEARIALTACVAQRPQFPWNYLFLAEAEVFLGQADRALDDFKRAATVRQHSIAADLALTQLKILQTKKSGP